MRNQKGFTLIELLIVILIIGILLALIVPNFSIVQDRARQTNVKNNMRIFDIAFGAYAVDHMAAYPLDVDGISYYLPGGDPEAGTAGIFPTNPYSGTAYEDGADFDYTPDAWTELTYQVADETGDCEYMGLFAYVGAYGEINIGGYDPAGTLIPVGFSIWGYGTNIEDPLHTSGTAFEGNRVYFIYYQ
jgi:prepilin-type N-terminal cleavage/methylation domain-containing protein